MSNPTPPSHGTSCADSRWARAIPALGWLRTYQPGWLRADAVAGLTAAAVVVAVLFFLAPLVHLTPQAIFVVVVLVTVAVVVLGKAKCF